MTPSAMLDVTTRPSPQPVDAGAMVLQNCELVNFFSLVSIQTQLFLDSHRKWTNTTRNMISRLLGRLGQWQGKG